MTGGKYYSNCDVWSLGILMLESALGRNPLVKMNEDMKKITFIGLEERVHKRNFDVFPENLSEKFKDFVR